MYLHLKCRHQKKNYKGQDENVGSNSGLPPEELEKSCVDFHYLLVRSTKVFINNEDIFHFNFPPVPASCPECVAVNLQRKQ